MTAMGNKVLASRNVSGEAVAGREMGGYTVLPVPPYEKALSPPPSHGMGPNRSPGEGRGVYGSSVKVGPE
jgi:hypothetical protein